MPRKCERIEGKIEGGEKEEKEEKEEKQGDRRGVAALQLQAALAHVGN